MCAINSKLICLYDRKIKDATYFYKLLHGFHNLNVLNFVSFVNHTCTHHCKILSLYLELEGVKQVPFSPSSTELFLCGTSFVHLHHLMTFVVSFNTFLSRTCLHLLTITFVYVNMTCSWSYVAVVPVIGVN